MTQEQIIREIEEAVGPGLENFFTTEGQAALVDLIDRHGEKPVRNAQRTMQRRARAARSSAA
ncbi:hypothetical protein ACFCXP_37575 [Streptomyces niveus]|uniref:hypothetical protein n=1 Tax=Streptomyces niveus TaxID=193462 RepID=UPI0035E13DA5